MNRCTTGLMAVLILTGTASGLLIPRAIAQTEEVIPKVRQFPKTAVRGELIVFESITKLTTTSLLACSSLIF